MASDEDTTGADPEEEADGRPPHRPVDVAAARRRAKPPALALLLVGAIDAGLGLLVVVSGFVTGWFNLGPIEGAFGAVNLLTALVIIAGGLNLLRLDDYGLALIGSITAMVPCLILGLPVGVWALVTASSPDVRAAFRKRKA